MRELSKFEFTDSHVESLRAGELPEVEGRAIDLPENRNVFFWCAKRTGLGLRLYRGARGIAATWVRSYQFGDQDRRDTIGKVADLSLDDAHGLVSAARMAGRFGPVADPRREKTRTTNAARAITRIPTFAEAAAEHLDGLRKRIEQDTFRPASFATRERYLNRDIYSAPFKALRLDEIDGGMIVDRIRFLEKTRSKYVAQGWRMAVFALFEEQIPLKRLAENPVKDTYQPAQPNKDQRIRKKNGDLRKLDAAEIAAVWNASDPATDYGAITRLALLCGDRRGELGGMRWNELNDDCSLWTIPPRRHKRGSQTGEPHTLPLAPAAQTILLARKARRSDRPLVFGVSSPKGFVDWGREKGYLDKRLGFDRKWKFHDLRRTLTSGMRALGVAPHITRAVVNHAQPNDVEERHYIVERDANGVSIYEPQKAEALRTWADHVLRLAGDNVVKLAA